MSLPEFEDLPFYERPDLSPYLIHLTKNTIREDSYSAFDNLVNILKTGEVWGSTSKGFIKGDQSAACFMDVPFISLKYILNQENCDINDPRYEPYGIFVTKKFAYFKGCRPVLYLSNQELKDLNIPKENLWRVVRFEASADEWISWIHEREWRCKGNFIAPKNAGVLVRNTKEVQTLQEMINDNPDDFVIKPRTILPLSVICQGLNV